MNTLLLYGATVLIWGSTWLAITYQLGEVAPLLSVSYRFALAAILLVAYCVLRGKNMRFSRADHGFIFLQGACLFGFNYWLFYLTTEHLTSGLVAVTFSTVVFMNIVNGRLFLGRRVRPHVLLAALIGIIGIVMIFWPELAGYALHSDTVLALGTAAAATYCASLGNILSARNQARKLPVLQTNAFGMGYGALLMFLVALLSGTPVSFDWQPAYLGSLFFLSVFGSIIAFGCYLTLIGRLGADRAAYASLLFPVVALQLSVWFEGYQWSTLSLAGMALVVLGNLLILTPAERLRRLFNYRIAVEPAIKTGSARD